MLQESYRRLVKKYLCIFFKVEEVDPAGPRAYHGTAVLGNSIYVIGGFDGMDYFNSCRCFDAVTKVWREVT